MHRATLPIIAILALTPLQAIASIDPEPLERDASILTPATAEQIEISVAAEEIDACRALLSAVLGHPPVGEITTMGAEPSPSLPVVQCVVEARAD